MINFDPAGHRVGQGIQPDPFRGLPPDIQVAAAAALARYNDGVFDPQAENERMLHVGSRPVTPDIQLIAEPIFRPIQPLRQNH